MRFMKKAAIVVSVFILFFFGTFTLGNLDALKNMVGGRDEIILQQNEMGLQNWTLGEDGTLISQSDPIIDLPNLNCYIQNVRVEFSEKFQDVEISPQIFWRDQEISEYSEENSAFPQCGVEDSGIMIPIGREVSSLRIDLFEQPGQTIHLNRIVINPQNLRNLFADLTAAAIVAGLAFYLMHCKKMLSYLLHSRQTVMGLVRNDLKTRYAGSVLGILWAFVQPIMTILVMWFVFQVGFRQSPVDDVEFILWFSASYIPWMMISDAVMTSTNCLTEYSYLVKKIIFPVDILPVMKLLSSLTVHVAFLVLLCGMFTVYGHCVDLYFLQIIYYLFCMTTFLLGLEYLVSAFAVFFRDFGQIVNISLQLLFWMSPIIWAPESMFPQFLPVLKLNPLFYILQGYRESMIYQIGFWTHPLQTVYFWGICLLIFITGTITFQKLSPHFADIL